MPENITDNGTSPVHEVDGGNFTVLKPIDGVELGNRCIFQAWGSITVDYEKSPNLQNLYSQCKEMMAGKDEESRLKTIYSLVDGAFEVRQEDMVDRFVKKGGGWQSNLSLDDFVRAKTGYCTQTLLAIGVLGAVAKQEGLIGGKFVLRVLTADKGQHLWVEHVSDTSQKTELDPMQNYFGNPEGHKSIEFQLSIEMADET